MAPIQQPIILVVGSFLFRKNLGKIEDQSTFCIYTQDVLIVNDLNHSCCNQALLLDPHNINLYHNRGLCYLNLGLIYELKSNSDALLLLDPGDTNTLVNRAFHVVF